jgi:hypothetical protein
VTSEEHRLQESRQRIAYWQRWGPYLSERAWGTVREDYSPLGTVWDYFPHDHARSKAYRWGEDGIGGICNRRRFICFTLALWSGRDPMLKERLFGLSGTEGNHGEDVKEYYFYLDSTPTHCYMKFFYKYLQAEFPYALLVDENRRRGREALEYELLDTGVFGEDRYFDVFIAYAKGTPEDILIRIQVINRGPETALLHLLPTIWCRNTWSWGYDARRPRLSQGESINGVKAIALDHHYYGTRVLYCEGMPEVLFTENETNRQRLYGTDNASLYAKDGLNNYIVHGGKEAVNPEPVGTKAAAHDLLSIDPGAHLTIRLRLTESDGQSRKRHPIGADFEQIFAARQREADEFYATVIPQHLSADAQSVMRQTFAGLLWSKQFYHYVVAQWLQGDPALPSPPLQRWQGRDRGWLHLYNDDVISMPDKWEYPWYAAWDLAFHCIPLALVDAEFAKQQLVLMLREWDMHPNGQLSAYEWSFDDVNPPVHAWAAWRVYKIERKRRGRGDRAFLEQVFHRLLLNFTWWVNRKDTEGKNIFQGGSRIGQRRCLRPQRPGPDGRLSRAIGCHRRDGHIVPQYAGDRVGAGQGESHIRERRLKVLRALRLHRPRHGSSWRRRHRAVG